MARYGWLSAPLATAMTLLLAVAACGGDGIATLSGQPVVASPGTAPMPAVPTAAAEGARMLSPMPGSILPAGAVTFTWDNANGDYFLQIESVAGAHDIMFATVHATSITLGPACAPTPPIECIPPRGEKIFVRLMTQTRGVWNAGFDYVYTAAGG
jgi:hypothetical protein